MSMGKLILTSILQNSQEFRTTDEHTVSRVYFDLDTGDAVLPLRCSPYYVHFFVRKIFCESLRYYW